MSNTEIVTPTFIDDVYEDDYEELVETFQIAIMLGMEAYKFTLDEIKLAFEEAAYNLTQEGDVN